MARDEKCGKLSTDSHFYRVIQKMTWKQLTRRKHLPVGGTSLTKLITLSDCLCEKHTYHFAVHDFSIFFVNIYVLLHSRKCVLKQAVLEIIVMSQRARTLDW